MPEIRHIEKPKLRRAGHRICNLDSQFLYSTKSLLQLSLNYPSVSAVVSKPVKSYVIIEGQCAGSRVCPLSRIEAGTVVCIKHLSTAPDITSRLRELGLCEEQQIKLLARDSNIICQVCNARLGISHELADSILVEAVAAV